MLRFIANFFCDERRYFSVENDQRCLSLNAILSEFSIFIDFGSFFSVILVAVCVTVLCSSGTNGQQDKWSWSSNNRNGVGTHRNDRKYEKLEDFG